MYYFSTLNPFKNFKWLNLIYSYSHNVFATKKIKIKCETIRTPTAEFRQNTF